MMDRTKIIVSRKWTNPQIEVSVSNTEINSKMDFLPFLNSMIEEMGNPTFIMTKSQLFYKLQEAAVAVVSEMKTATRHL